MAKQWQMRRGTTSQNDNFTGVVGELTVDTTTNEIRVHDGSTEGGHIVGETSKQVLNQNTLSTTEKVKTWMGSEAEYEAQDIENEHPDYVCYITDDEPADSQEYNLITYPMRNVGDIFFTSRLDTDLNGAVECDGSTYYLSNYQGVDAIYNLFTLGKLEYISMSDYADDITNKGWCDKFGWDGEGNDEFKIPTLTAKVIQENNIPVIGNGVRPIVSTKSVAEQQSSNESGIGILDQSFRPMFANMNYEGDGGLYWSRDPEKSGLVTDGSAVSADLRVMVQLAEACLDDTIEKNSYDLFDVKWTDHTIKNIAWARADTFDWKDGRIYTTAYKHLKDEIVTTTTYYAWDGSAEGILYTKTTTVETGDAYYAYVDGVISNRGPVYEGGTESIKIKVDVVPVTFVRDATHDIQIQELPTPETETISDITITYYLAEDGHKIVLPDQESNVSSIYTATGIAWYYILDIENERFKLPRTKFAFTGLRDTVGKYVEAGLPNIIGNFEANAYFSSATGAMSLKQAYHSENGGGGSTSTGGVELDASKYNSIYGNSNTVQPKATEMYLYFYLGEFTTTSLKNAATFNLETINNKVTSGHEVVEFQVPTAENNYTWYRKYADGWIEQGGIQSIPASWTDISLPIEMLNSHYTLNLTTSDNNDSGILSVSYYTRTVNDFKCAIGYNGTLYTGYVNWEVKGMAA